MTQLVRLGRPLVVHSARIAAVGGGGNGGGGGVDGFSDALPQPEYDAIRLLIRLCRETRCAVHLIHPSASEALPMIAEARAERLPMAVATCPGHLAPVARAVHSGGPRAGAGSGSGPALDARGRLWDALASGLVDVVGPDLARESIDGPGRDGSGRDGSGSLRLALSTAWSEARRRGSSLEQLARWMAGRPAELFGLSDRKGAIVPGRDADFVVFDPDTPTSDNPIARDDRVGLVGRVEATILRGTLIGVPGQTFDHPTGAVVLRLEETEPIPNDPR
jgi:allantoinase